MPTTELQIFTDVKRWQMLFCWFLLSALFGLPAKISAQCGVLDNRSPFPLGNGTSIRLVNMAPSVFSQQDLQYARSRWSGCSGYGTQFPSIDTGSGSGRPVNIHFVPSENPNGGGRCETVDIVAAGGTLVRADITIYLRQNNGQPCGPLEEEIGHAIGHVFGLDDAENGSCQGTIMGTRAQGQRRSPAGIAECSAADWGYEMLNEPPDNPGGGGDGGGGDKPNGPLCV